MKFERATVKFPMWRKKVDSSLFEHKGTHIPFWVCDDWGIQEDFLGCSSKKSDCSQVKIEFDGRGFKGWITERKLRPNPKYRLWFDENLCLKIKHAYLMSHMRDIEYRLRKKEPDIEQEIPFWEFIDIEYDRSNRTVHFTNHYVQKPTFPALFQRLVTSPTMQKIDDEVHGKKRAKVYGQGWKPRNDLESEIGAVNVIYFLIDSISKLLYIGEAKDLISRLKQPHLNIPNWDYYRYNVLPDKLDGYRVILERMIISDYVALMNQANNVFSSPFSGYTITNKKVDLL